MYLQTIPFHYVVQDLVTWIHCFKGLSIPTVLLLSSLMLKVVSSKDLLKVFEAASGTAEHISRIVYEGCTLIEGQRGTIRLVDRWSWDMTIVTSFLAWKLTAVVVFL